EEIKRTREALGWEFEEDFYVPEDVREHMEGGAVALGSELEKAWNDHLVVYAARHPEKYAELSRRLKGELPENWSDALPRFEPSEKGMATRASSGKVIEKIYEVLPELIGGSADLAGSNKTLFEQFGVIARGEYDGQNVHFGIREHAMAAIANGLNLHEGTRGFGATFLVFSDYMRPSLRLAALMHQPTLMVFTHDSIGLGEDGPTHQPIEHLAALRAIPNFRVLRPADANEVRDCWRIAVEHTDGPSALVLTRQNVPTFDTSALKSVGDATKGAYILADAPSGTPEVILMSTGSEVAICLEAWRTLTDEGIEARLVSMPSWEVFSVQDKDWQDRVLPPNVRRRLSVEAATTFGWERWVGFEGATIGIDHFGASAPFETVYEKFGLTPSHVADRAKKLLA
ncbi:MAG: transketolase-like TK C-terminal-containing protein, partial [Bradymonadaceae bacterium]